MAHSCRTFLQYKIVSCVAILELVGFDKCRVVGGIVIWYEQLSLVTHTTLKLL